MLDEMEPDKGVMELEMRLSLFGGSPFPPEVVDWTNQSQVGGRLMNRSLVRPLALYGTVAVMLTLTVVVTLFSW